MQVADHAHATQVAGRRDQDPGGPAARRGAVRVLLAAVLIFYGWMIHSQVAEPVARAASFIALVVGDLSLALAEASAGSRRLLDWRRIAFWVIAGLATIISFLCLALPPLPAILQFAAPSPSLLLSSVLVGMAGGGWYRLLRPRAATSRAGSTDGSPS